MGPAADQVLAGRVLVIFHPVIPSRLIAAEAAGIPCSLMCCLLCYYWRPLARDQVTLTPN